MVGIKAILERSDRAYTIESDVMSDDARPYGISGKVMIWLNTEGFLGELEAIYPPLTTSALCQYGERLQKEEGFPRLEVIACNNEGSIQTLADGFVVWLAKEKVIDQEVTFKTVQFLFAQEELVGIVARQALILE